MTSKRTPGQLLRKLDQYLFPMASGWLVLAWCQWALCLFAWETLHGWAWVVLLYVPVPVAEYYFTRRFSRQHNRPTKGGYFYAALAFNLVGQTGFYIAWVAWRYRDMLVRPMYKGYGPWMFTFTNILWKSMGWVAAVCLVLWLATYWWQAVKKGRFRLALAAAPYFLFSLAFFQAQWLWGGLGYAPASAVMAQKGVVRVFDPLELEKAVESDPRVMDRMISPPWDVYENSCPVKVIDKSRFIYPDEENNTLLLTFGGTYYKALNYPTVVRKDLKTGALDFRIGYSNLRKADLSEGVLYIAPWYDNYIYGLSEKNLSVVKAIPTQVLIPWFNWEPFSPLKDCFLPRLYLGTEFYPSILAYNLDTGKLRQSLDLSLDGITHEAGVVWTLTQSKETGLLYAATGPPAKILEIDNKTLEITRVLDLGIPLIASSIALDEARRKMYAQSFSTGGLLVINLDQWKVENVLKGSLSARTMCLDSQGKTLYVADYFMGVVFGLDTSTGERTRAVRVGGRPSGLALSPSGLWAHSMVGAFRIDLSALGFTGSGNR